jgi:predicted Zn-dependent peptidase
MSVELSRLANGLTVVTDTMATIDSVALSLWVKSGSRDEAQDEHGIAHLLEHMAFKGTSRRSAFEIAAQIEDVGGEINAATSLETTSYYARVLKEDVPLAVEIIADILTDSLFDDAELAREKHVILQEIGAAHDTPDDVVFDKFTEAAFRHQTLGRSILGTEETIRDLTASQIRAFVERQYAADRIVMVASGAIDHDDFVRTVEQRFGDFRATSLAQPRRMANYVGGDYREARDLMDAQILLGFEGKAFHMRDFYASQILSMILGGGMSSRLFQEIREKRGLCYSIYAFHWGFSDTGLFGIHAATGKGDVAELVQLIIKELHRACESISPAELARAISQYRAGLLMSRESASSRTGQIARQMLLYGRPVTIEEQMERLEGITIERLTDLSSRLFVGTKPTIAAIGPIGSLETHSMISSKLSSHAAAPRRMAV